MDEIDIRSELKALYKALGINPKQAQSLAISSSNAEVVALSLNDAKEPYIDPQTNEAATITHLFSVRTS